MVDGSDSKESEWNSWDTPTQNMDKVILRDATSPFAFSTNVNELLKKHYHISPSLRVVVAVATHSSDAAP